MSADAREDKPGRVTRLLRVDLPVADLSRAAAFYHDGLGFVMEGGERRDASCRWLTMRLGAQAIRLVRYHSPGRAYPGGSTSADLWFQHIALVVSDMPRAFQRVSAQPGFQPISRGGPQRLPANTGSVTAFKFRDPDGHPLELIYFPQGAAAEAWPRPSDDLFLGYDHSAICVSNLEQSLRFYTKVLGLRNASHSLNRGPEQARLDGLIDPVVDVNGLAPARQPTPHIELLCYHVVRGAPPPPPEPADIAGAQLVLEADDCAKLAARLKDEGHPFAWPQPEPDEQSVGRILMRDPDGHLIALAQPPVANPG